MNLTALQHSPFLQSLGWAIANSLWQAAALWIAYYLVTGIYKGSSARFKNNLSTLLLSSSFVWFCITFFKKYFAIHNLNTSNGIHVYIADNIYSTTSAGWDNLLNNIAGILPYLSVAYLLLLIFLSLRLINIYRFTYFIKVNGLQKPGAEWKLFTDKVARHMGLTKKIKLWVSSHIDVPATIGFLKPVILIPLASVNRLSSEQMEAIILHELSHIKRNDYLINLLVCIIETTLFFNPFVVLLSRIIKRERENCCDDFVIQYQYDRHTYASALLSLEQFRNINLRLAIGATSGKKQLLLRIKRIMEINNNTNFNYGQKLIALLLITTFICSVAWLSPQNRDIKKQASKIPGKNVSKLNYANEKIDVVNFKESADNIKHLLVKARHKKEVTEAENALKSLQDLNASATAQMEVKRLNLLMQETQKQIPGKKLVRTNTARFGNFKILQNDYQSYKAAELPASEAYAYNYNPDLYLKNAYDGVDWQKAQRELDKLKFSSDDYKIQNEAMQTLILKQLKNLKSAEIENLIKSQRLIKYLSDIDVNRTNGKTAAGNNKINYIIDSLIVTETRKVNNHLKQIQVKNNSRTIPQVENNPVYTYGYEYTTTINDGNKVNKKPPVKIIKGHATAMQNLTPTPEIPAVNNAAGSGNNQPKTMRPSKITTIRKENLKVEYKDGTVTINGIKVALPETKELLTGLGIKPKEMPSAQSNIIIYIND